MWMLWTSKDAVAILLLICCVGWPREGFSEAYQEGTALLHRELACLMKGRGISYQSGASIQLHGR